MENIETKIVIRLSKVEDLASEEVSMLCQLINRVYDDAESGIWKAGAQRTDVASVKNLLEKKLLLLAEVDGSIKGCISVEQLNADVAEFGILVVDFSVRSLGIGLNLIKAAEKWAMDKGCKIMQLNLLTPKEWPHPKKEFLKAWYERLGYVLQGIVPFEKVEPAQINDLATPCHFVVYRKNLI